MGLLNYNGAFTSLSVGGNRCPAVSATNRNLNLFLTETLVLLSYMPLHRYEIVHQRVDDMLMYPVPLNNIKGYSLDVSTESHAIATLDKLRNKNCLLLAILASALAALCFLVGRFEDHPDLVVAGT